MSNQGLDQFTPEEIFEMAQGNINALSFLTVAYLKQHGLSPVDYWHFVGERLADGWSTGMNAMEIAEGAAINSASSGASVAEMIGDENHSLLVINNWPPEDMLEMFETKLEDADTMMEIFRPITEQLGFDYQWKREDEHISLIFIKK